MDVWIGCNHERHGPYKEVDVRQWLRDGRLSPDDLAWHEGLADWQALSALFPDEVCAASMPEANTSDMGEGGTPSPFRENLERCQDYAGFWKRALAFIIDWLILLFPKAIVLMKLGGFSAFEHLVTQVQDHVAIQVALVEYGVAVRPSVLMGLLIVFAYYVLFECSRFQATPGKLALGLRVSDLSGKRLGLWRAAVRNMVRLSSACVGILPFMVFLPSICYIAVAFTARKQGLHDLLAQTLVLNGRANKARGASPHAADDGYLHA